MEHQYSNKSILCELERIVEHFYENMIRFDHNSRALLRLEHHEKIDPEWQADECYDLVREFPGDLKRRSVSEFIKN